MSERRREDVLNLCPEHTAFRTRGIASPDSLRGNFLFCLTTVELMAGFPALSGKVEGHRTWEVTINAVAIVQLSQTPASLLASAQGMMPNRWFSKQLRMTALTQRSVPTAGNIESDRINDHCTGTISHHSIWYTCFVSGVMSAVQAVATPHGLSARNLLPRPLIERCHDPGFALHSQSNGRSAL